MNGASASRGPVPFDPQRSPWSDRTGLRAEYRDQLERLDERLVGMGRDVLDLATGIADGRGRAPVALDAGTVPNARRSLGRLQARAGSLEDAAFTLVALESPVGGDLRELVAVIRAVYDMVRAGRLALHVLESVAVLERSGATTTGDGLGRMRSCAVEIFRGAVLAWAARDALAHNELRIRDDEVDALRDGLLDRPPVDLGARCVTAHVLVVRCLERFADHGVDICAHLSWAVTGERVLADFGGRS